MLLAKISGVDYRQDNETHTVAYASASRDMVRLHSSGAYRDTREMWFERLAGVIAQTEQEAFDKLAAVLRGYLVLCYWHPNPRDFTFSVSLCPVEADGTFGSFARGTLASYRADRGLA